MLIDYIKHLGLSLEDTFDVFDENGSEELSQSEFMKILDRICG